MMRLRILELPSQVLGEYAPTPFVLVIDRCGSSVHQVLEARPSLMESSGARGVLVFSEELEIEV